MSPGILSRISLSAILAFSCAVLVSAKNLKITTNPPGATVELDDKIVGATPFEQEFPSGYFQRPITILQKRLEHPIHVRLTSPPDTSPRKSSSPSAPRIGSISIAEATANIGSSNPTNSTSTSCPFRPRLTQQIPLLFAPTSSASPLALPPPFPCASIASLRRAEPGFIRFSFAPRSGTQVGPRSPSNHQSHQAPARACSFLRRTIAR